MRVLPRSAWDVLAAAACAIPMLVEAELAEDGGGLSVTTVALALLTTGPLVWRRRAPLPVLALVCAGITACLFTFKPHETAVIPAMLALYTVADLGDRRRSIAIGLAVSLLVAGLVAALSPHGLMSGESVSNVAMALLALVVGDAVRSRREVLAGVEERARRRVTEERLRVARELHDVVAHAMVAINVQAGVAAHLLDRDPEQARAALIDIKRVSGEALDDLRGTLGVLRAGDTPGSGAPIAPTPGLEGVADLVAGVRAAGLEVQVELTGEERRVPAAVGRAGYRIVQEALTNVLRHAGARQAELRIAVSERAVEIEVLDDGAGSATAAAPDGAGHGVLGMSERAAALGGAAAAGARTDGAGWRVHALLPLRA